MVYHCASPSHKIYSYLRISYYGITSKFLNESLQISFSLIKIKKQLNTAAEINTPSLYKMKSQPLYPKQNETKFVIHSYLSVVLSCHLHQLYLTFLLSPASSMEREGVCLHTSTGTVSLCIAKADPGPARRARPTPHPPLKKNWDFYL